MIRKKKRDYRRRTRSVFEIIIVTTADAFFLMISFPHASWTAGYKNDPKQRAGGYMPAFTFERALASAFTGLFSNLDTPH